MLKASQLTIKQECVDSVAAVPATAAVLVVDEGVSRTNAGTPRWTRTQGGVTATRQGEETKVWVCKTVGYSRISIGLLRTT